MRSLALAAAVYVLSVCLAQADEGYWVPMLAPDGKVYELQILPADADGLKIIVCAPIDSTHYKCLARRDSDGAYGWVKVAVEAEPDPNRQT